MIVINLMAGAGAGKSALAGGLLHAAKKSGANVEFVSEYAKDMVWEGRTNILDDQLYILAKQNRRLHRLRDTVDYVITDTSLFLGMFYARYDYYRHFFPLVKEVFDSYDNFNIWVQRPNIENYSSIGRTQDAAQALEDDEKLRRLFTTLSKVNMLVTAEDDPAAVWNQIVKETKN